MKKNYLVFVTLISLFALGNMACKKSSSGSGKSKTELITQAAWHMDDIGADMDKNGTIDLSQMDDCTADDLITFNTNGTGENNEGTIICQGSTQTSAFNWVFKNNETVINIDIDELDDISIDVLNDSQFKGHKEIDNPFGSGKIWVVVKLIR